MSNPNILFMMSGSIACAKATSLVSEWVKRGHAVKVACTPSVEQFVGHATLEGLSGQPVFGNAFEPGQVMDHIGLAQWADWVVVCPATSNLLNKLAAGLADDAVSTLWQAAWGRGKPMFVVPAMNTRMWNYPATRASLTRLRQWGVHVLPTATGELACGEEGVGRMLEPAAIMEAIDRLVAFDATGSTRRVLITGGGTREAIDTVRYIGNHSTGRTSVILAESLSRAGFEVTWLGAAYALPPRGVAAVERFHSFTDLQAQLQKLLGATSFDLVVHAAAVSDFSVAAVSTAGDKSTSAASGKLPSASELNIRLTPNPKLLNRIRSWSCNPQSQVIGFKLTSGADLQAAGAAVARLFDDAGTDAVVHNDLAHINADQHAFTMHYSDGRQHALDNHVELALAIETMMELA